MVKVRFMPQYRGVRLRPYMRYLKHILFGVLAVIGLIPLFVFCWFQYEKMLILDKQTIYYAIALLLIAIAFALYFTWFLCEATILFAKLDRLVRLARFLYEHGYVYEKKIAGSKQTKKTFPKIYMKQGAFYLEVSFEMAGSKFQEKFKKIGGDLETTFSMDFMEVEDDVRYKKYILAYSAILDRLQGATISYVPEKGIELMKNFYWDFVSDPHMLVVGGTGGGKTVFLRFLILCLSKIGIADICDPKRADFVTLEDLEPYKGRIFYGTEEIVQSAERALEIMEERFEFMRKEQKRLGHTDLLPFNAYGLEPYFWVCDELNAFRAMTDYRQRERFDNALGQIVLLGRQAGVNVIGAMQKPSREDLSSKLQANINFRVSLGRLDETGYDLAFEEPNRNKEFKYMKYVGGVRVYGRGYAAVKGQVAREFYSPEMKKGFSFFDEFSKIERHEHKHNLATSEGRSKTEIASDSDGSIDVKNFAEMLGITFSILMKIIKECEQKEYLSFEKEEGKYLISTDNKGVLMALVSEKMESGKSWSVTIDDYFAEKPGESEGVFA